MCRKQELLLIRRLTRRIVGGSLGFLRISLGLSSNTLKRMYADRICRLLSGLGGRMAVASSEFKPSATVMHCNRGATNLSLEENKPLLTAT